jgi:hypothetical protein
VALIDQNKTGDQEVVQGRSSLDMLDKQASFEFSEQGKLEKKFWEFHFKHPEVLTTLAHFAREWRLRRGPDSTCGVCALYERARWEMWFQSLDDHPPPKLSNNHKPFYARLIMERYPDLAGIFKLKRQKVQATFGPDNQLLEPNEYIES